MVSNVEKLIAASVKATLNKDVNSWKLKIWWKQHSILYRNTKISKRTKKVNQEDVLHDLAKMWWWRVLALFCQEMDDQPLSIKAAVTFPSRWIAVAVCGWTGRQNNQCFLNKHTVSTGNSYCSYSSIKKVCLKCGSVCRDLNSVTCSLTQYSDVGNLLQKYNWFTSIWLEFIHNSPCAM